MDQMGMDFEVNSNEDFYDLLEIFGNPKLAKKVLDIILTLEKFGLFWIKRSLSQYPIRDIILVGAMGEGLSALAIVMQQKADGDIMVTLNPYQVVERHDSMCLNDHVLKLENSDTHPGYALLRSWNSDQGSSYFTSDDIKEMMMEINVENILSSLETLSKCHFETHGPALKLDISSSGSIRESLLGLFDSIDIVLGIHCDEWPSVADEWIERDRLDWPSGTMIANTVEMGCDLVQVGVSGSRTENIEWRISFARAERYLIQTLNSSQFKTISLLKVLFKAKIFGERFHQTISSYVAKTSFFWISEEYDGSKWQDRNCIYYLWLCLQKILRFVSDGNCPNFFIRDCNVLHEKLTESDKRDFSFILEDFTKRSIFKDKILHLPLITYLRKTYKGFLSGTTKTFISFIQIHLFEKFIARALEERMEQLFYILIPTPTNDRLENCVEEVQCILEAFRGNPLESEICMHSFALQDFFIRCFTCAQLRLENIAIPRDKQCLTSLSDNVMNLLSKANLNLETLCVGEITQIAHVFFTNKLYEKVLNFILPMLLKFRNVPCYRLDCLKSIFLVSASCFLNMADESVTSPRRPVCDITFYKLEEPILTEHLRLEIVCANLDLETSSKFNIIEIPYLHHVRVHPLVYACYMKYKCYKCMQRNPDSYSALQELEEKVMKENAQQYHNLNLLGCSLHECRYFEKALKIFALSYKNRLQRRSILFHISILLKDCFKKTQ